MENFLLKEHLGEFFAQMYQANKGKNIEVNLMLNDDKIQIYNREDYTFKDVRIIDGKPNLESLIKILSE